MNCVSINLKTDEIIVKIDDNTLSVAAKASIEDFNERFDQDIPNEDFQTIGGYVFGLLGREPEVGDVVSDKDLNFKVLEVDGIRIARLNMQRELPFVEVDKEKQEKEAENNV